MRQQPREPGIVAQYRIEAEVRQLKPFGVQQPFGIAFVEALDAGLPVVTFDFGGASEIVTPACGLLLPPDDRASLAGALQRLIDDTKRRREMTCAGPARARLLCDPLRQVARLEAVLQ